MWAGRLLSTCQVTLIYYVSLEEKKAKPMAKPSRLKIYILVVPYHRFPVLSVEARDPPPPRGGLSSGLSACRDRHHDRCPRKARRKSALEAPPAKNRTRKNESTMKKEGKKMDTRLQKCRMISSVQRGRPKCQVEDLFLGGQFVKFCPPNIRSLGTHCSLSTSCFSATKLIISAYPKP